MSVVLEYHTKVGDTNVELIMSNNSGSYTIRALQNGKKIADYRTQYSGEAIDFLKEIKDTIVSARKLILEKEATRK